MSTWTDFRDNIENKVQASAANTSGTTADSSASSGVFNAIYQYGRGQADSAVQTLTKAFRATAIGQKVEATATQQKITELMPYIVLSVLAIVAASYFVFHRR